MDANNPEEKGAVDANNPVAKAPPKGEPAVVVDWNPKPLKGVVAAENGELLKGNERAGVEPDATEKLDEANEAPAETAVWLTAEVCSPEIDEEEPNENADAAADAAEDWKADEPNEVVPKKPVRALGDDA